MKERTRFVTEHASGDWGMAELCRRFGISRPTGYKWLERYESQGAIGLEDRSSAPRTHPNQTDGALELELIQLRREHPTWGPKKLLAVLAAKSPKKPWPSASTAGTLLKRAGLAFARKPKRRASPTPPEAARPCAAPNDLWRADFKGWFATQDGTRCDPLTITDGHTRYLLRCQIVAGPTGHDVVRPLFEAAFRQFGLPLAIHTDNGPPFASCGLGGLSKLSVWWIRLGILPERSRPGHPQDNGSHERMHRTYKAECPPQANPRAQQRASDRFAQEFNNVRPHETLGQRTPASLYEPSPRPFPSRLAQIEYAEDWPTRSVRGAGQMQWKGRDVLVSRALCGQRVGLEEVGDGVWIVHFARMALGAFDERKMNIRPLKPKAPQTEAEGAGPENEGMEAGR